MKKMINLRNYLIVILCITIICLGIGFIVVSQELNKEQNYHDEFNVVINKVEKQSTIKGGKTEPTSSSTIEDKSLSVNLKFKLNEPHDEITYIAKIKNKGTTSAEIVNILVTPDFTNSYYQKIINPVKVEISDVKGKIIEPDEELEVKITAIYNPTTTPTNVPVEFEFKVGLLAKTI